MEVIYRYGDDNIFLHHSKDYMPKDNDFPMHLHDQCEIFFFISGKGFFWIEGMEYILEPGCLILLRDGETHKIHVDQKPPYERISLHFSKNIINNNNIINDMLTSAFYDRPLGKNNLYLLNEFSSSPQKYFNNMTIKTINKDEKRLNIITNLYPLLGEIRSVFLNKKNEEKIKYSKVNTANKIAEYININLFNDLSLDVLSKKFFLSKSQLNRIFKKSIGSSIGKYIIAKRFLYAKQRIKNGEKPTDVALEIGYCDYSTFYRNYINQFNISPKDDFIQ